MALSIDFSAINQGVGATGTAAITISVGVTAPSAGDILVVLFACEGATADLTSVTITDTIGGLTWNTRLIHNTGPITIDASQRGSIAICWAYAPSSFSSETVTITPNGIISNFDDAVAIIVGVTGFTGTAYQTAPWDTDSPVVTDCMTGASGVCTVSGYNTSSTSGLLLGFEGGFYQDGESNFYPPGFAVANSFLNYGGADSAAGIISYLNYTSAQTSATFNFTTIVSGGIAQNPVAYFGIIDALTIPAGAPTTNANPSGAGVAAGAGLTSDIVQITLPGAFATALAGIVSGQEVNPFIEFVPIRAYMVVGSSAIPIMVVETGNTSSILGGPIQIAETNKTLEVLLGTSLLAGAGTIIPSIFVFDIGTNSEADAGTVTVTTGGGGGSTNANPTGASATLSAGSSFIIIQPFPAGTALSGSAGTTIAKVQPNPTGSSLTTTAGLGQITIQKLPTGVTLSGSAGLITPSVQITPLTVFTAGQAGTTGDLIKPNATGTSAITSAGIVFIQENILTDTGATLSGSAGSEISQENIPLVGVIVSSGAGGTGIQTNFVFGASTFSTAGQPTAQDMIFPLGTNTVAGIGSVIAQIGPYAIGVNITTGAATPQITIKLVPPGASITSTAGGAIANGLATPLGTFLGGTAGSILSKIQPFPGGGQATATASSVSLKDILTGLGTTATSSGGTIVPTVTITPLGTFVSSNAGLPTIFIPPTGVFATGVATGSQAGGVTAKDNPSLGGGSGGVGPGNLAIKISDIIAGVFGQTGAGTTTDQVIKAVAGSGISALPGLALSQEQLTTLFGGQGITIAGNTNALDDILAKTLLGISSVIGAGSINLGPTVLGTNATASPGGFTIFKTTVLGVEAVTFAGVPSFRITSIIQTINIQIERPGVFMEKITGSVIVEQIVESVAEDDEV